MSLSIETKVAVYQGTIKGLPDGFSTNGAMVEEGSNVIVASSESAIGYYRFDLTTMLRKKFLLLHQYSMHLTWRMKGWLLQKRKKIEKMPKKQNNK